MYNILICDDDRDIINALKIYLSDENYKLYDASNGLEALAVMATEEIHLILMDVMMPKLDGFQLAKSLRAKRSATPILMLTAKSEVEDRIYGLNCGADYYLTKPFDTRELLACINALLRRQGTQVNELTFGNTSLELDTCMLICGDQKVRLSAREFDVMRHLLQAQGRNLPKETILARVWGFDSNAVENHVEVYVGFLRKKLTSIGSNVRIEAIRRQGYHLEVEDPC